MALCWKTSRTQLMASCWKKATKIQFLILCLALLGLSACSTVKSYYLGNKIYEYEEKNDLYWTLVNFGNADVNELVRKNKVGVAQEEGTPRFKKKSEYDLSQFNFVEVRRHHGQSVMVERFKPARLVKTMKIEGLAYRMYEFTANKGKIYHTFEFHDGKYVTQDKDLARAKRKRFQKKHR